MVRWLFRSFDSLSRPTIFVIGTLLVLLIGWADYLTGQHVIFTLFYLLPIIGTTWFCGKTCGIASAVLCAFTQLFSDSLQAQTIHPSILVINAATRLVIFFAVTYGMSTIKHYVGLLNASVEKERQMARTDSLTGLPNTRAFYEVLSVELERSQRHDHPLSLAYMDIDDFKRTNDNFGHLAGDDLLKRFAAIVQQNIRQLDTAARLGGDELAIFMPETTLAQARPVLERIRKVLAADAQDGRPTFTISVGIVSYAKEFPSADLIVSVADNLMYKAKQGGKNRVIESARPHLVSGDSP